MYMDISTFIDNFVGQFDNPPSNQINGNTRFRDLDEWSSLLAVSIIEMIIDEYGVSLTGDDIRNAETVQDIYDAVVAKMW